MFMVSVQEDSDEIFFRLLSEGEDAKMRGEVGWVGGARKGSVYLNPPDASIEQK